MKQRIYLVISLLLSCYSTQSMAVNVYKWVDEQGKVHYGQQAITPNATEMKVYIGKTKKSNSAEKSENDGDITTKGNVRNFEKCEEWTKRLEEYKKAAYLVMENKETGEKEKVSEEVKQKALFDAKNNKQYWCGDGNQ